MPTSKQMTEQSTTYEDLALYPLNDDVLVPHTSVSLQIIDPTYRAMAKRALHGSRLIALAMIDEEVPDTPRGPAVHDVAGIAKITDAEELAGGRYVLELTGVGRALVTSELDVDTPYRQIRAVHLEEKLDSPEAASDLVWSIRGALLTLQERGIDGAEVLNFEVGTIDNAGAVADVVGAAVFPDPNQRRRLLEELDVLNRLQRVDNRLADLVVRAYRHNPPEAEETN